jgi:formylglycine-generating enzyme required for sulfatase activity
MSADSNKPVIFISYSHKDEPEHPRDGEIQWLSFVLTFLKPAVKHGIFSFWFDRHMVGGTDWDAEIERNLCDCDIFVLLVSANSMASDYIVDREIAIIRERQAKGSSVHFYPLLLTPTPKAGLEKVKDKNLRPRDAKPFSRYSAHDRAQHMSDAADEIAELAECIVEQRSAARPGTPSARAVPVHATGPSPAPPSLPHAARIAGLTEQFRAELATETRLGNVAALIFDLLECIRELPDPSLWTGMHLDQLRNAQELLVVVFYGGDGRVDDGAISFGTLAPLLRALSALFAGKELTTDYLVVVDNELAPYVDAIRMAIGGLATVQMPSPARAEVDTLGKYLQILEHRSDKRIDLQRVDGMAARIRSHRIGALHSIERLVAILIGKRLDRAPRFAVFRDAFVDGGEGPELIIIPAGEFQMGSAESEANLKGDDQAYDDEIVKGQGKRPMRIARRFALGRYPVTFEEYDAFLEATSAKRKHGKDEADDHNWGRGRRPVINVSWDDAQAYCDWLNQMTGLHGEVGYRLPSEAEWEYACRAGTQTRRWWGDQWDPAKANGSRSFEGGRTSPVGHYAANPWGLYDMIGNVEEWCADQYVGNISDLPPDGSPYQGSGESKPSSRVLRGGSWNDGPQILRSALRGGYRPVVRVSIFIGFRVARTL